tara:strand:- start:184 stop:861 length:678 start_codon:yes stop_codon:yes gene_type:complete
MTRFLASIKNIEEAKRILFSNIDIIDFKNVEDGALGFVGLEIVSQARKLLKDHIISVTMGNDLNPNNDSLINNINSVVKNKIEYIKIGMFDISMLHEHKKLLKKVDFFSTKPICVVFADQDFDLSFIQKIIDIGYKGVMIDTCHKNGKSILDLINKDIISKFIKIVKDNNVICGLSGSLKLHHIKELKSLDVNFLGFRGELCSKPTGRDFINISQVEKVSCEIKS